MFGQSSTPFGSSQSTFGQTNTAPTFGAAPAPFGAPAPAPSGFGGFGAPAPAPSAFGGFGTPSPAPAPAFGGSAFGAPAPAPAAFGGGSTFGGGGATSSPFGAPAPAPSGGLFGAPAPAPSGGLFGAPAPAPSSGFGTSSGFGFGAPAPAPAPSAFAGSTFGAPAPAPSTGLFGAPAPAPSAFGSTFGAPAPSTAFGSPAPAPSTGLFGAPAPAPSGGLFGAPATAIGQGGTKGTPYQVTSRQDGTSAINIQAITAMNAYEQKSFDELRFEDYSQGNRGSATNTPAPATGFGFGAPAPAPSGGLFGAPAPAPTSAFGAPAPSAFGGFGAPAPAPSAFGAFGSPAPAPAPFGSPAPAPAFGAPAPGGFGGFGAKAPGPAPGLFGAPAPAPGGGLFGAPAPAPFGAPAPAPGGLFGAPAPAPAGGLFGAPAPAPGGLFGQPSPAPAPAFGAPAPAPSAFGGFGAPSPAPGGLFGAPAPAPAFGAPPASGGLFGSAAPSTGLFGNPAPAPPPTSGGLFGVSAPAPSSAFGAPPAAPSMYGVPAPAAPQMPAAPPVGAIIPPIASDILAHQLAALDKQRKELEQASVLDKGPSETSKTVPASTFDNVLSTALTPSRSVYATYRATPSPNNAKVRPRNFVLPTSPAPSLRSFGKRTRHINTPISLSTASNTRLIINPRSQTRLLLESSYPADEEKEESKEPEPRVLMDAPPPVTSPAMTPTTGASSARTSALRTPRGSATPSPRTRNGEEDITKKVGFDYYQQIIGSPDDGAGAGPKRAPGTPTLTKDEYKCFPSIETLQTLSGEELAAVSNFSVEREGFGKIEWEGDVDVRGADLDRIAVIEQNTISMYLADEEEGNKPPVGSKLNRAAELTLYNVFPKNGGADADDASKAKFARKVEKSTLKMGAELISYDPSSGVWKMRVQHFSKYGLDDDSDSEHELPSKSDFESGERGGRSRAIKGVLRNRNATPYRAPRNPTISNSDDEELSEDEAAVVSDMDVDPMDDSKMLEQAETALALMNTAMQSEQAITQVIPFDDGDFSEVDCVAKVPESIKKRFQISESDILTASSAPSICERMATSVGMKSSQTDFGIRFGRTFRVGWSPDGSFLSLAPGSNTCLVRKRPVLSKGSGLQQANLLEVHQAVSKEDAERTDLEYCLPSVSDDQHVSVDVISSFAEALKGSGNEESTDLYRQSISLLSSLHQDSLVSDLSIVSVDQQFYAFMDGSRQLSAVLQWLVESCSVSVDMEILQAKRKGRPFAAILAAMSGGDMKKACAVAREVGCSQLALLLSAGPHGRAEILEQARTWAESSASSKFPEGLIRIYFLLGGDVNMEKDLYRQGLSRFDWRRRLAIQIAFGTDNSDISLSQLMDMYETDLSSGVVPFPSAQYGSAQQNENAQSTMFRLMRMSRSKRDSKLCEIVNPLGHTNSSHDFALSFHLAAIITALGYCQPMGVVDERLLMDGYVSQLIDLGLWDWAVYVTLCSLSKTGPDLAIWKEDKAKSLITRFYDESNPGAKGKRQRLEGLGLPSEWFEESLAYRCFGKGDVNAYLRHMAAYSPEEACEALEQTLIPNILFMNKRDIDASMNLVEAFSSIEGSLTWATYHFFEIQKSIHSLEYAERQEVIESVPGLSDACKVIEQTFTEYLSIFEKKKAGSISIVPEFKEVPMLCFLSEVLSQIRLLKLQLRALQSGISIRNSSAHLINLIALNEFDETMAPSRNVASLFM